MNTHNISVDIPLIVHFPMKNGGSFHSYVANYQMVAENHWFSPGVIAARPGVIAAPKPGVIASASDMLRETQGKSTSFINGSYSFKHDLFITF